MTQNAEDADRLDADSAVWWTLVQLTGPAPRVPVGPVDWSRLINLAFRHKSVLLLRRNLDRMPEIQMPDPARRQLENIARAQAFRALLLARETCLVASALRDAGIKAAVMKGAPLSLMIHYDLALRDPGDIDILLPPSQAREAAVELEGLDYRADFGALLSSDRQRKRLMRVTNQLAFLAPSKEIGVELHWRWQKVEGMMPTDPHRAWAQPMVMAGMGEILVPDRIEHFIYLCAHGLSHGWMRLKWLNDIRWTLQNGRLNQNDWEGVVDRAREIGMSGAVGAAALVAARIDNVPLPPPIERLVQSLPRCEILAEQSLDWMLETASLREDPLHSRHPLKIARSLLRHTALSASHTRQERVSRFRLLFAPTPPELVMIDLPRGLEVGYLFIRAARMLGRALPARAEGQ